MSGIATLTRQFVDAVAGTQAVDPGYAQDRPRAAPDVDKLAVVAAAEAITASGCST